jgi:hypothetical protein
VLDEQAGVPVLRGERVADADDPNAEAHGGVCYHARVGLLGRAFARGEGGARSRGEGAHRAAGAWITPCRACRQGRG